MVHNGLGKHVWAAPPNATRAWALGLFIAEITYTLGLVFVKWSILAFYWRIFNARPSIRIPIWIMFFIVCSWGTAVVSCCHPSTHQDQQILSLLLSIHEKYDYPAY